MKRAGCCLAVLGALACGPKAAPPLVAPEPEPPAEPEAEAEAEPPTPSEQLAAEHFCEVEIDKSVSLPDGFVVGYTYREFDSRIGEMEADGLEVQVEVDAAIQACEKEREEEDDYEDEYDLLVSCEIEGLSAVFDDNPDELNPDCERLGVAYFDLQGKLLEHQDLHLEQCFRELETFELRPLVPEEPPMLLVVYEVAVYGAFSRGGWGYTDTTQQLVVVERIADEEGDVSMSFLLEETLDQASGENCEHGTGTVFTFTAEGFFERYAQDYDICEEMICAEDGDDGCEEGSPVAAERYAWDPEERTWDYDSDIEYDDTVLPFFPPRP